MFDGIIRFSLKNRLLIVAITAFVVVYGLFALRQLPVDVFPDLNRPTVTVLTDGHGMAPEEVELVISRPLETALNGTAEATRIYSTSTTGLSLVRIEFAWNTDLRLARMAVSERLQLAKSRLPEGVDPIILPTSSILGEIQMIGMDSPDGSVPVSELRSLADWTVKPRLLSLNGVSQVTVIGGDRMQAQVLVNADKLRKSQVSFLELKERLGKISGASSGGYIAVGEREWLIRNFGRILNHDEISETAVGMHFGRPVTVKDVAEVKFDAAPKRGEAAVNGRPGVILMVQKQPGADTLLITESVDAVLRGLQASLPRGAQLNGGLFKQSHFIETAIGNVSQALRDGSLMVMLVLILFLMNFRTTAITLTAIPLSLLVTAIVFYIFGIGVNTMTLGGLAVAMGELVDDAIVDVENIFRRLRENAGAANPKSALRVVYEASSEVRNSIVFATIIIVLVFVPLFALPGLEGRLFTPIGIGYVVSLLASLLISLTVTPVLCFYFLKGGGTETRETRLVALLKQWHRANLERTLNHPARVTFGIAALVLASILVIPFFGRNFLPPFNEGSAMLEVEAKAGISLDSSTALAAKVESALKEIPEVVSVGRRTGRADEDEHSSGINHSEFEINLKPSSRSRSEVFADIRGKAQPALPDGAYLSLSQPISHRLDHVMSGVKSQVSIKVFGPDIRVLRQEAAEIRNAVADIRGVVDLRLEGQVLIPQYKIYGMRPDLKKYGIIPGDLMESLEAMLQGVPVTRLIEKERYLDVYLRLDQESRKNIEAIRQIPAHVLPTGQVIPLEEITDIFETSGPNVLERENLQRRVVVSFNTAGRDLASVMADVKSRLKSAKEMPEGYHYAFDGQFESQRRAMKTVVFLGGLSLLGIFLVLFAHFRSAMLSAQIMVTIPLALVGAVAALLLTDRTFTVATLIAFITLCGIASRNSIMLISHYIHLMKEEGEKFSREMVIRGSLERLVPVLMTAFSAIFALTPLLFAKDQPGKELLHPVAVIIVGGLLTSTLLDIFLTPAIFYRFGRRSAERLARKEDTDDDL